MRPHRRRRRLFPELAGLCRALAAAPALVEHLAHHGKALGAALFGRELIIVHRVVPAFLGHGMVAGPQLRFARLIGVVAGVEQTVQKRAVQRGRAGPRVDDHAVDAVRVQRHLHGGSQKPFRHGAAGRAFIGLRHLHGGEHRQVAPALLGAQGPGLQVFCFLRRDRMLCPRGGPVRLVGRSFQRHQDPGVQLEGIVDGVHQRPEALLVLALIERCHSPLYCRTARTQRPVFRQLFAVCRAHRAQPQPCRTIFCHCIHHSFR